ncbi:MAG: membrane protein insertion efficiency factor YidD [Bacillota bacterium]
MKGGTVVSKVIVLMIEGYRRYISPLKPRTCRFYPSCSTYALEAVQRYGALKGGGLAVRRLLRCHPLNPGGYDPVPGGETE